MATDLVERYISAVGRHLPRRTRADVESELHSLLLDSLESRAAEEGRPADDDLAVVVLREFGPPQEMAQSYLPRPQYVVGPRLFPIYRLILIVVATVLVIMQLVGLAFSAGSGAAGELLASGLLNLGTALLSALGSVTLVFFVLERFLLPAALETAENWDPRHLPPGVRVDDRINVPGEIVTICFMAGLLALFNFFPQVIGVYNNTNGVWRFTPILAPAYRYYLLPFNLLWIYTLVLSVVRLVQGRWGPATRWLDLVRRVFSAAVLLLIVMGPSLVGARADFSAGDLSRAIASLSAGELGIDASIRLACAAGFLGVCLSALKKLLVIVRHVQDSGIAARAQ